MILSDDVLDICIMDDGYERGNGLWSTLKLVVEKNGGKALIISNNGCLDIINKEKYKYSILNKGTTLGLIKVQILYPS